MQLAGKTALVTGAAKRIGRAIATRLHRAGANVVLHYRNAETEANALARLSPEDPWLGFGSIYATETMLRKNRAALDAIARALLRRETLDGRTVERIVALHRALA